tara:strand:+ start:94 stop:396 length:303 start_codon:yes stop_codon:yes gene_type:complete
MKKNKKVKYVAKLTRVMDEGESSDNIRHIYGKATNRLNELHQDDCPRVRELGHIIDIFVNTIASGKSCMSRRRLVKIGFEILNQRDKATNNTRKHMTLDY